MIMGGEAEEVAPRKWYLTWDLSSGCKSLCEENLQRPVAQEQVEEPGYPIGNWEPLQVSEQPVTVTFLFFFSMSASLPKSIILTFFPVYYPFNLDVNI